MEQMGKKQGMMSPYASLAVQTLVSGVIMYLVMFVMIDGLDSCYSNLNMVYMRLMMVAPMVVLLKFTPVPRKGYRIGVPSGAAWCEVLNTDSMYYGGSNLGNGRPLPPPNLPWMCFEHSVEGTIPPLGAIFLKPC